MKNLDELVPFPKGLSNFRDIVMEGYYFVDKTPYIEKLEKSRDKLIAFLRPRRIGKSLFVSVLEYYYGKEHQDKFDQLFGNYYIGQNPTPLANQFAVLKMDFSGIDTRTEESAYQGFLETIKIHIGEFNDTYGELSAEQYEEVKSQSTPELVMKTLLRFYKKKDIYFILDEYDHFTNEILIQDLQQFKRAVTQNGYVRKFYEVLKEATQKGIVNRIFITGVSPLTLDSLTSGFNIINNITNELEFHDMMGFTEEEVSRIVDLILEDSSRKENLMQDLRDWYNGYCFHVESQHRIYNSNMVLYFCDYFQRYQGYPRLMLDPNIAPDYGKLKKMFEIQNPIGNYELLHKVIYEKKLSYQLIYQFSFDKDFSDAQFISFLYYMGYLTIHGESKGLTEFVIPNLVIQELYWEYFAWLLSKRENIPYDEGKVQNIVAEMTVGNLSPFLDMITEVLVTLSNRDYQNFDEKYVKVVMISFLALSGIYHIKSESEHREGYSDLLLLSPPSISSIEKEYLFEIKYIKKAEASEAKIDAVKEKAKIQILKYLNSDASLRQNPKLLAYTLVFVKDEMRAERVEF